MNRVKNPLPCFVCERELDHAVGKMLSESDSPLSNQPDNGVYFSTHGNFGSTVYDPMFDLYGDNETLEIAICDDCLIDGRERSRETHGSYHNHTVKVVEDKHRMLRR